MANQKNVEVYANLFRVPLEDGAKLVCECRDKGESVAKFVGRLVVEKVHGRPFGEMERKVADGIDTASRRTGRVLVGFPYPTVTPLARARTCARALKVYNNNNKILLCLTGITEITGGNRGCKGEVGGSPWSPKKSKIPPCAVFQ